MAEIPTKINLKQTAFDIGSTLHYDGVMTPEKIKCMRHLSVEEGRKLKYDKPGFFSIGDRVFTVLGTYEFKREMKSEDFRGHRQPYVEIVNNDLFLILSELTVRIIDGRVRVLSEYTRLSVKTVCYVTREHSECSAITPGAAEILSFEV